MGPLFLTDNDQKRVQYYFFFGKIPNEFLLMIIRNSGSHQF